MYSDIYTLLQKEKNSFCIELVSNEHEVFKAHFKDNPLLPGFIFFEICSNVLEHEIISIKKAKFLIPVKPKERLIFFVKEVDNKVSIKVENEKNKIAEYIYEKK